MLYSFLQLPVTSSFYGQSIYLSICLSVYLSICLSARPPVRPSDCPSVRLSICMSVLPSFCPSVRPSACLSDLLSLRQSVRPSLSLISVPIPSLSSSIFQQMRPRNFLVNILYIFFSIRGTCPVHVTSWVSLI